MQRQFALKDVALAQAGNSLNVDGRQDLLARWRGGCSARALDGRDDASPKASRFASFQPPSKS